MAVNKNFVVKNGLEVNDDLILANAVDSMVGIGTSVPYYELHVQGGIGATSLWVAGVSTFTSDVSVAGVTTLASAGGITTVGGDLFVGGDLSVLGDVTYDEVVGRNLNITGVGTILNVVVGSGLSVTGISTLTGPVGLETGLTVAGVTTLASAGGITTTGGDLYVGGDLFVLDDITYDEVTGRNLNITGIGTITRLNTTNINNTGVSTITRLNTTDVVSTAGTITTGTITQLTNTDFVSTSSTITSIVGTSATITRISNTDFVGTGATFSGALNAQDIIKGYKYTAAPYGSTTSITVTVATKTAAHRYYGQGSSKGYVFDGLEAPFITLTPGRTYRFDQSDSSNSTHQIKFYLEADKTTLYEGGVTYNGTAGSSGAYTQIVVGDETPTILHYMCINHGYMGNAAQVNSNVVNTNYEATLRGNLNVSGVSTFASGVNVSGMSTFASGLNVSGGELNVGLGFSVSQAGVVTATKFVGAVDATGGNFSGVGTFSTLHVGTSGTVLAAVDSATISLGSGANPVTATLNGGSIPSIGLAIALGG